MVAHGAESHLSTVAAAYGAYNSVVDAFAFRPAGAASAASGSTTMSGAPKMIMPAPGQGQGQKASASAGSTGNANSGAGASSGSAWQRWGRLAVMAGGTGVVAAAAGAAAYMHRDSLSAGWNWASSHLEFVGCLARGEELRRRVGGVAALVEEGKLGFADFYTVLGRGIHGSKHKNDVNDSNDGDGVKGGDGVEDSRARRTFAMLPAPGSGPERFFLPAVNEKAADETSAHMAMFTPAENPGYEGMLARAGELVVGWVAGSRWYREAEREVR